jgi:hypothetical protein
MRSLEQIMNLARAEDFTKDNAAAIVKEQVDEMVATLHYQPDEARKIVLANIGYYCGYYSSELADKVYEMFETQHPIFGRAHPSPEEILRMGIELGRRSKKEDA